MGRKFSKNGFETRLKPEWFSWILSNKEKVGLLCNRLKEDSLHIYLLIIFTPAQKQGLATLVTNRLKTEAHNKQLSLTLSCFKNNKPALSLYRKLGYIVSSEDDFFMISLVKSKSPNKSMIFASFGCWDGFHVARSSFCYSRPIYWRYTL